MSNVNYDQGEYKWVLGYLSAFEHVNDRRNSPSHFQFERILQDGSLEDKINAHLGQNSYPCRDVQKTTLSSLENASDVLSDAIQAWLFDFMFYKLNKANNTKLPVWQDPTQYFNLSVAKMRSDRAIFLSKKIIEICKPSQSYIVKLQTGERKWYEHGTNFLFTNETNVWWLRLGEVF